MGSTAGILPRVRAGGFLPPALGSSDPATVERVGERAAPTLLVMAGLAAAYFLTAKLTITLSHHWRVHPIWSPVGIAVAVLLIFGPRVWPGIAVGSFMIGWTQGVPADIGTMVAQTMGPLLVVRLLEAGHRRVSLDDPPGVLRLAVGGAVGMLPVAVLATAVNDANHYIAGGNWLHFGADWWVGDTMGILLVTPFLLGLRSWRLADTGRWVEVAVAIAAAAVGTRLLFSGSLPLMFLVFPFTLWAALRFPPPVIAALNVVVAGIAIWTTAEGYGPFSGMPSTTSLVLLESFNAAVAITSLVLGAAVTTAHRLARENERLHAEVRSQLEAVSASRSRIVESAYRERHRVERDLHDGAQQRLVSLAYSLGLAVSRAAPRVDDEARATLARTLDEVRLTLSELRSLAQGIHPALLTQGGLGTALESLAEQATIPVAVRAPLGRFPPVIEAAAYFVVSESLANVAKHARARAARVSVTETADGLVVDVVDDGIGGADPGRGSGLTGLVDRVCALDGHFHIDSPLGGGTRIRAVLPCDWS